MWRILGLVVLSMPIFRMIFNVVVTPKWLFSSE